MITDTALLMRSLRTPTSAFAVSMWYIPDGHRYDQATSIVGFFEASEEDEMRALVARNAMPPEMAMILPIEAHDKAARETLNILERRRSALLNDRDGPGTALIDLDIAVIKARLPEHAV